MTGTCFLMEHYLANFKILVYVIYSIVYLEFNHSNISKRILMYFMHFANDSEACLTRREQLFT